MRRGSGRDLTPTCDRSSPNFAAAEFWRSGATSTPCCWWPCGRRSSASDAACSRPRRRPPVSLIPAGTGSRLAFPPRYRHQPAGTQAAAVEPAHGPLDPPPETPEVRARRLAREAEMIAEADADIAAGRTVSLEAVEAWVASLGTDRELPVPQSGR